MRLLTIALAKYCRIQLPRRYSVQFSGKNPQYLLGATCTSRNPLPQIKPIRFAGWGSLLELADPKWSDFQSLLQFAAGSNLALYTLSQFPDQFIPNERELLRHIRNGIASVKNEATRAAFRQRYFDLSVQFSTLQDGDETVLRTLGTASAISFVLSLVFLIVAAYFASATIAGFFQLVALIVNLPMLIAVIYISIQVYHYRKLVKARRDLDDEIDPVDEKSDEAT
jgi:hypothetical protein